MIPAVVQMERKICCPHCGKPDSSIESIFQELDCADSGYQSKGFGPWYCDHCNWRYHGEVTVVPAHWEHHAARKSDKSEQVTDAVYACVNRPGSFMVRVEKRDEQLIPTLSLLWWGNALLIVSGCHVNKDLEPFSEEHQDNQRFYYEENTAMINILHSTVGVLFLDKEQQLTQWEPEGHVEHRLTVLDDRFMFEGGINGWINHIPEWVELTAPQVWVDWVERENEIKA